MRSAGLGRLTWGCQEKQKHQMGRVWKEIRQKWYRILSDMLKAKKRGRSVGF